MCLRNVSGTVRVIKMTSANRLTASGCIASRWVYRLIVNLLETPDGKFRDNMHTLTLVKFRTWDSWHSNQPCVWNADGDWHSFECGARRHFCEVTPDTNKQGLRWKKSLFQSISLSKSSLFGLFKAIFYDTMQNICISFICSHFAMSLFSMK